MKRFVFPLARLERLREIRRTQARATLARSVAAARSWRERAETEQARLLRPAPLDDDTAEDAPIDGALLKADAAWREGRRALADDARRRESEARAEIRRDQSAYALAARDHRVVERLREKRFDRWRLEAERDERLFLDEIHLMRLLRRRREETR